MTNRSVFLGLALVSAVLAQQPQQNPAQPAPGEGGDAKKPGAVQGQVVNAKTGEPVRRVNLTLRPFGTTGMGGSLSSAAMAPAAPYAAATDAEGKFRIERVEPGSYRLMAERQGFVRGEYGARPSSMMGTTIRVAPGQEVRDLNFKLTPQAVVMGRVLDEEGEPLARVQIQVLRQRFFRGKQQMAPMGGGQTIDTGEFRVADLPPGRYWINATYRGGMMRMFGEAPARRTDGKPEEEYVTTYYPNSTDEAGARAIDLAAGQEMSGIDIRLRKARVYRISGKVAASARPVRNVRLMVTPRNRDSFSGFFGGGGGMVKEDGTFEIGSVQPGSYYVVAVPSQGMMSTMGKAAVDVSQEDVSNVILTLAEGVTVKGVIRLDGDVQQQEQVQGKKITFGSVRVQLSPMEGIAFNIPGGNAKEDGSFAIENAGPERYRMLAMNLPPGVWLKSIRVGDQEVLESGIDVSAGTPGPIEVVLGVGVGQITGVVQDAKQQPASGSMVTLLPDPMKEGRNDLFRVGSSDQNGQFTLQGIAPGEYKLFAWEDVEPGRYLDPEFLKLNESSAKKVAIKANGQERVTLAQIPAEAPGTR